MIRALANMMLLEGEPTITLTLANLISNVSTVLSSLVQWMVTIFNTAIASPVVLLFLVMAIIGVAVGFGKKLLHF